jgi:nucleoside-diphosphate-sugar epimerase
MRILLTGSEGFVGRHFDKALSDEHLIVRIDKRRNITCQNFFNGPMSDYPFDMVIHCAAMVGGRAKIDGDPLAIAENLAIDSDMFRWVIRRKIPRVVYFSSSAAYPTWMQSGSTPMRLHEVDIHPELQDVGVPDQTYGWAKLTGEILARYAAEAGSRVHIFRPFSGYGEDQDLDYPFPSFIDRAARRADPFEIWGDGTQTRDFIHIDDIVGAVLKAIDEDITDPVNLGWGRPTSFNELADLVTGAAGYDPEIRHLMDKPMGCMYRVANPGFMKSFYTPKVTLEEGIERALAWKSQ